MKLAKEVYGDRFAQAKTPADKRALAKELLEKASDSQQDRAAQFVLLKLARDISSQAGDVPTAFRALEEMESAFQIDALEMQVAVLNKAIALARSTELHKSLAEAALAVSNAAVAKDSFSMAGQAHALALDEATKSRDRVLIKQLSQKTAELEQAALAYKTAKQALATLEKSPTDPEANLAVGQYRCFVKGEWEAGLPLLALGSDETLKTLATKELNEVTSSADQAALGDLWWELADKESAAKNSARSRALHWYRQALPGLAGLVKAKVEKRLGDTGESPAAVTDSSLNIPRDRWIEPVKRVDLRRDTHSGDWKLSGKSLLVASAIDEWLRLPLRVEGAYDLEVVFVRHDGQNNPRIALPVMTRQVVLHISAYEGQASGLEPIGGETDIRKISASKRPAPIVNGRPYTVEIKVRPTAETVSIDVSLNGTPYVHWEGKQELLGNEPGFSKTPAVGGWYAPLTFRSVRFRLISGKASWIGER